MGNCIVIQQERSWVDEDEDNDFEWSDHEKQSEKERIMLEVKVKITKKQLQDLLLGSKRMPIEKALEEIIRKGSICKDHIKEAQWKPRLQSIPELQEERYIATIN